MDANKILMKAADGISSTLLPITRKYAIHPCILIFYLQLLSTTENFPSPLAAHGAIEARMVTTE